MRNVLNMRSSLSKREKMRRKALSLRNSRLISLRRLLRFRPYDHGTRRLAFGSTTGIKPQLRQPRSLQLTWRGPGRPNRSTKEPQASIPTASFPSCTATPNPTAPAPLALPPIRPSYSGLGYSATRLRNGSSFNRKMASGDPTPRRYRLNSRAAPALRVLLPRVMRCLFEERIGD